MRFLIAAIVLSLLTHVGYAQQTKKFTLPKDFSLSYDDIKKQNPNLQPPAVKHSPGVQSSNVPPSSPALPAPTSPRSWSHENSGKSLGIIGLMVALLTFFIIFLKGYSEDGKRKPVPWGVALKVFVGIGILGLVVAIGTLHLSVVLGTVGVAILAWVLKRISIKLLED